MCRRVPPAACVALFAAAVLNAAGFQDHKPQVKARVDAFFAALASGDAEKFEAMARENFEPAYLARRSADERKALVARIHADFGEMTLAGVRAEAGGPAVLDVRGATGMAGRVELTFEPAAPYRITGVGIDVEAGGGRGGRGGGAPGLPPVPVNASMTSVDLSRALDAYVANLAAADKFAGVVLVAKDGVPVYEKGWGLANRETKASVTPATRFNLGSINKIFTKTAIASLIAQGKLALGDTIGTLLPDYPNPQARNATIRQLLEHQAGIADFFGPDFEKAPKSAFRSNTDYYRFVAPKGLLFEPGTRTQYCNGCYVVLGAIIERVARMPYERYIDEHVFKPAGMKTAGFFQSDRFPANVALGYTLRAPSSPGKLASNEEMHGRSGSAAGGAFATAQDLLAFDNALREGRLLDPKMTAWVLETDQAAPGRSRGGLGVAGGAPGCNAVLEADGTWTVAVVGNLDPPTAEQLGTSIARALRR
ncbi:MAG: serine hydrolase domain-containing protein [Bacteroidales bacterium]